MARGDLTDEEWSVLKGLLPSERGRKARPFHDNRLFLNGMLHVLRVGCPWRDMHERYGKWNSVYVRFRRWAEQGVWDAMLRFFATRRIDRRPRLPARLKCGWPCMCYVPSSEITAGASRRSWPTMCWTASM